MEAMLWVIFEIETCCLVSPLMRDSMICSSGKNSVSIQGPSGQNVSNAFDLAHCSSMNCKSLAVTSLAMVYPKM